MESPYALEVSGLGKEFGNTKAVDNITFNVKKGEIFGFLGVNGAGKTTTLRMITGILSPDAGTITVDGIDLQKFPSEAKQITGYIPDRPFLYPKLTAREYLRFVGSIYKIEKKQLEQRIEELLNLYTLSSKGDLLIEGYSHGMKQRVATCAALINNPRLLVVDEPMVGLDPHGARQLLKTLREFAASGMAILLSTHSLNVAEELCDRLAIIQKGKILTMGTLDEIKGSANLTKNLEEVFIQLTLEETSTAAGE